MDKIVNARVIGYFQRNAIEERFRVDLVSSMSCGVIRRHLVSMFGGGCDSVRLEFLDDEVRSLHFSKQEYCTLENIAEFMYMRHI